MTAIIDEIAEVEALRRFIIVSGASLNRNILIGASLLNVMSVT